MNHPTNGSNGLMIKVAVTVRHEKPECQICAQLPHTFVNLGDFTAHACKLQLGSGLGTTPLFPASALQMASGPPKLLEGWPKLSEATFGPIASDDTISLRTYG